MLPSAAPHLPSVSRIAEFLIALSKITLSMLAEPTLFSLTPTDGVAIGKVGMAHFGIQSSLHRLI